MATSPLFGWEEPDDVDLVKDGAAAIRTLGNAIDTSMGDLLGGTSGQVLSKNSNTNMDFTWVTPDDANAIQNAIVDAKGDLIAASAADTPARLAVGNNGETLVADSSTSTGLRYQSAYNGNGFINGGMDYWQRGTSFSSFVAIYTADRWLCNRQSAVTGLTISRQTSGLTGIQYSMRAQRDSGNTGTQDIYLQNSLESADSYRFAGQTVTVSFWAKAGANFSATSSNAFAYLYSGTGTDQNLFSGYTGNATVASSTAITLTTSWQRFSITGTVGSTATELGVRFGWTPTGTASTNDWMEITGVQLELGSVATSFKRAGGTIQGELAACQRYYYRNTTTEADAQFATGIATSTSQVDFMVAFPVSMRVKPSTAEYGNLEVTDTVTPLVVSTAAIFKATQTTAYFYVSSLSSVTQYRPYFLQANTSAGYIGFSAEL